MHLSKDGIEWNTQKWYIGIVESRAGMSLAFSIGAFLMTQKQFYKTQAWRRARQAYIDHRLAVDGGVCEVCGDEPGKVVHHRVWLDDVNCNDPEISLNPANLRYECQACHNKEYDPRKMIPGRCRYGPNGEIVRNTDY